MLYLEQDKFKINAKSLFNPFIIPENTNVVHFHWQNAIWKFAEMSPEEFVLQDFPKLFDYKKINKNVKTIWTVHNALPNQNSLDNNFEIALMQKLSDEADIIHLLSKESLIEIEKYITIDHKKIGCQ
jgi:hypothetical protein